ncbi:uncharacterized protein MONBRDRAFT_29582 [Monosiga brevicollis MX1]|uniref:RNA recognition motif domain-containing protein n=1 Tax=Monosiga brevicollis TaxID=81824 RepID=A9VBI5_MONBE|nr:uncharacterized protein MONBRDRAFT_29582 [Monosiga brevicollis MX1]EDQ85068.1 predicted protein [Monosiga brevicollis MX1]|eukprot:XP_001750072.1 hypothetical protein [Monosiga brevicollis MX1]
MSLYDGLDVEQEVKKDLYAASTSGTGTSATNQTAPDLATTASQGTGSNAEDDADKRKAGWGVVGSHMFAAEIQRKRLAAKAAAKAAEMQKQSESTNSGTPSFVPAALRNRSTAAIASPALSSSSAMMQRAALIAEAQQQQQHLEQQQQSKHDQQSQGDGAHPGPEATPPSEPFIDTDASRREIQFPYDPSRPNEFEEVKAFMERQRTEFLSGAGLEAEAPSTRGPRAAIAPPPSLGGTTAPAQTNTNANAGVAIAPPSSLQNTTSTRPKAAIAPPANLQAPQFVPAAQPGAAATPSGAPAASKPALDISGEEAFAKRQALSMSGEEAFAKRQALSMSGEEAFAKRQALSMSGSQAFAHRQTLGAAPSGGTGPTRVVLLQNMVGPGEVDGDLQPETANECSRFGQVTKCTVFECPRGSVRDDQAVRIFVEFADLPAAARARQEMHGRFFGGRQVRASFFDADRFARQDLAPRAGEP